MNRHQLLNDLTTTFTAVELAAFSARLGVNYPSLGGKTTADKAGSLIGKMERNGRLSELVYLLVQERPQLQKKYESLLKSESAPKDAHLEWLDGLAAGKGPAIEEPPTMRWDSTKHPREDDDG